MKGQLVLLSAPMLGVLAGCVANGAAPAPAPANAVLALQGIDYRVTGSPDLILTRLSGPMGYDEGLTAKRVAEAHCAGQGRALNAAALGRFQAGSWVFAGGCA